MSLVPWVLVVDSEMLTAPECPHSASQREFDDRPATAAHAAQQSDKGRWRRVGGPYSVLEVRATIVCSAPIKRPLP